MIPKTNIGSLTVSSASDLAGWINPEGHYYQTGSQQGHMLIATQLTGDPYNGDGKLLRNGWVKLTTDGRPHYVGWGFTQPQIDALNDLAQLVPNTAFSAMIQQGIANGRQRP